MSNTTKNNSPTNARYDIRKFHKDIEQQSHNDTPDDNKRRDNITEESKEEFKTPINTEQEFSKL